MPIRRLSFWLKVALAMAVVALADFAMFDKEGLGANLGIVLTAATLSLAVASPAVRHHRMALTALAAAFLLALLPFERPSFVGFLLWSLAMALAALAPRAPRGEDGLRWAQRLIVGGLKSIIGPPWDLQKLLKARARSRPFKLAAVLLAAALPVVGGLVFLALFVSANPVIAQALGGWELPAFAPGRVVFWGVITLPLWAVLRPRGPRRTLATPGLDGDLDLPGATVASIATSLVVFNVVFALQNGLDVVYLWSGAGLPKGVSFADYAHQGAYPLIATALLAGMFVLVFLRPGSATAQRPLVRGLVIAWVAQNVFLVASTILRTTDYIEAYSLTRMRIAALLWMALVALGLLLILWRVLRGRSSSWLINANLAAAGVVLLACSLVDLGAVAAAWNVRHAREVGGKGVAFDLSYAQDLRGAALVSLADLERRAPARLRCEVADARVFRTRQVREAQSNWRTWRFRDARRLDRVEALLGPHPAGPAYLGPCGCEACPPAPPPQPATATRPSQPPLTPNANPRT